MIKFEFEFSILVQGLTKIGMYPKMLFIAMLFLAFLFYHSLLLFPTLVLEMLFIAFLLLAFLVAIFNIGFVSTSSIISIYHMSKTHHGFGPNINGCKTRSLSFKPTRALVELLPPNPQSSRLGVPTKLQKSTLPHCEGGTSKTRK